MYRNVCGFCDKENKNLDIRIEFIPCGTQEGKEYALGKIDCAFFSNRILRTPCTT